MQAVYFIALFGLVFAIISSFTVGISANTMQIKEGKLAEVQRNFDTLEFAINNVYLKEHITLQDDISSLTNVNGTTLGPEDLSIFLPYMRTNIEDLVMDPWRTPITYYAFQNSEVFCSDTTPGDDYECWVEAPVVYFVMVSAGPNRQFESGPDGQGGTPNADPVQFMSYANPIGSDDIVKAFSTQSAMRNHYNNMVAVEDRVAALMLKSYRDQAGSFFQSEQVTDYIEARLTEELGDGGFFGNRPVVPGGASASTAPQTMEFERPAHQSQNTGLQVMEFRQSNDGGGGNDDPPCTANCFPIDITQEEIFGEILDLPEAKTWPGYPRMRGTSEANTPDGESVPISPDAYGAESELQFDPFCLGELSSGQSSCLPFTIYYDNAEPWKASIERGPSAGNPSSIGGWRVYTRKVIDGKKEL